MKHTDKPIVVEQTFDTSIKQLWNAITRLTEMKQWFFENIDAFEPKVGFRSTFVVENEGRKFTHLWKITKVEPFQKISYNWKYKEYSGNSFVTFLLSKHGKQSKLTLSHQIMETFPQDILEFQRENCKAGWDWFIKERLKGYLKEKGERE